MRKLLLLPFITLFAVSQANADQVTSRYQPYLNIVGPNQISGLSLQGPAAKVCGAACTLTALNSGSTTLLNLAAGSTVTLPAATGTGNIYNFVVSTTVSSNADKILAASSSDAIIGTAIGENAGTAKVFVGNAGTFHSLQMPFAGTQPSGGFAGDSYSCQDISTNVWECNGNYQAGTTPTTPYNAATS